MELRPASSASDTLSEAPVPMQRPPRTWAGHGSGASCDLCGNAIREQEIEYEVDAQPATLHFHFNCYQDWSSQRAGE